MQFLILGFDGMDELAAHRREVARTAHIELGEQLVASGNMWYGAVLLNDFGVMKGSMLMMDFTSEEALQEWLSKEPYVVGKVWERVEIHKCHTREPWQFNRSKEFFKNRL